MNREQMMKKVSSLTSLPTLPVVAMELNRMLQDMETPIERLVELLERDQSLVMKILRLVNSSFFGLKNRVTSLRHAVTLLGYSTVQSAVVTISVIDGLKVKHEIPGFDIGVFWTHAIAVAVMTRQLAERTRLTQADEAFTAGLLHDVGKIVLVNHFPTSSAAYWRRWIPAKRPFSRPNSASAAGRTRASADTWPTAGCCPRNWNRASTAITAAPTGPRPSTRSPWYAWPTPWST